MAESMIQHAAWLLFVWVLGNQAGVPIPVVPSLLAAGALARNSSLDFSVVVAVVVGAALCADLAWYGVGRWRGTQALGALRHLLRRSRLPIDRMVSLFATHQLAFLLGARFLPELNPVAAGLAGATRVRFARYIVYAAWSALLWAGTWAGLGYVLGGAVAIDPALFDTAAPTLIAGVLVAAIGSGLVLVSTQAIAARSSAARSVPSLAARAGSCLGK